MVFDGLLLFTNCLLWGFQYSTGIRWKLRGNVGAVVKMEIPNEKTKKVSKFVFFFVFL